MLEVRLPTGAETFSGKNHINPKFGAVRVSRPVQVFLLYDLRYENMINKSHKVRACFNFANMIGSNEVSAYARRYQTLDTWIVKGFEIFCVVTMISEEYTGTKYLICIPTSNFGIFCHKKYL